jgi:hypothetical protein
VVPNQNEDACAADFDENLQRFPNYGWQCRNCKEDCEFTVCTPPADNLDVLKNTWVTHVRTYDMDKKGETHYRKFKKYTIPISWWEPMAKWISETRWSIFGLCDAADGIPKHHLRATWAELLLAFQVQTGYRFHDELDFASLEKAFKTAFRKLMNITVLKLNGRRRTTQQI